MRVLLPGIVDCGNYQQGNQQTAHKERKGLRGAIDTLAERAGCQEDKLRELVIDDQRADAEQKADLQYRLGKLDKTLH